MDSLFPYANLLPDTVNDEQYSVQLTSVVNNILTGVVQVDLPTVLDLCRLMLLGDDKEKSSTENKALAYIARVEQKGRMRPVVRVVNVNENIEQVMVYREKLFGILGQLRTDHITVLSKCCQLIINHPRYTSNDFQCSEELTMFTYTKEDETVSEHVINLKDVKNYDTEDEGDMSEVKRQKTTPSDLLPHDLKGADILFEMQTSPPRSTMHAIRSPRSREVYTGSSVMSAVSDVASLSSANVKKAVRSLEEFFEN